MSHYIIFKYGMLTRLGRYYFYFILVSIFWRTFLIKTITPLALVGYEMIITNSYQTRARENIVKNFSGLILRLNCLQAILLKIKVVVGLTGLTFIIDTMHFKVKD